MWPQYRRLATTHGQRRVRATACQQVWQACPKCRRRAWFASRGDAVGVVDVRDSGPRCLGRRTLAGVRTFHATLPLRSVETTELETVIAELYEGEAW